MRMRKKKHGAERIEACSALLIKDPSVLKNGFSDVFGAERPVHLEIGCGKGGFACAMAEKLPEVNYVAMERVSDVCCVALEKAKAMSDTRPGDNLRFIIADANILSECAKPHSVDCIYLNFSDPWPKAKHAKRRLTYRSFLEIYRKLLKPDGVLKFKTDNVGLFDFSLEEFEACGLEIIWQTRDLHNTDKACDNVMTEYEKNFSEKGFSICSAWVRFKEKNDD